MDAKGTAIYLSHGGGPLPLLGDPGHRAMVDFMKNCRILFRGLRLLLLSALTGKNRYRLF